MSRDEDRPQPPSDATVPATFGVGGQHHDVLRGITELAELLPRELWQEVIERWTDLGLAWSNALAAQVLGVPEGRVTRWQRRRELPLTVRQQLAALCQLLSLLESGELVSLSRKEISNMVALVRGRAGRADDGLVQDVLSLLTSLFDEPAPPPAI